LRLSGGHQFRLRRGSLGRDFAGNERLIRLANPIASQLSVMRSSLIGGLLANVTPTSNVGKSRVRVFETGRCFFRDPLGASGCGISPAMETRGAGLRHGAARTVGLAHRATSTSSTSRATSNVCSPPLAALRERLRTRPCILVAVRGVLVDGQAIGFIGELHPQWQQKYELPLAPVLFELDLDPVTRAHGCRTRRGIPPADCHPRPMAIVVDHALELQQLLAALSANRPAIVQDIHLFDVYVGRGVEAGKKSLAFRIMMQDTRKTLLEAEVDAAMQHLMAYLQQAFRRTASRLRERWE
jgi:phenylalanyl-tRNA synthetase beta chain